MNLFFDKQIVNDLAKTPILFPKKDTKNIVICVAGVGVTKDFSTLITNHIPDLQLQTNGQCFPLYYYEELPKTQINMFDAESEYVRRDAISDFILKQARVQYGNRVSKEDIFYYVYGFLHSPTYRETFANDLKRMLPRLPLVEKQEDFWAFSQAGKDLAALHLAYETQPKPAGVIELFKEGASVSYRVEKMRFGKKTEGGKNIDDKSIIIYNSQISIENIPLEAYAYVVNGKSAIEWIMERYHITTHKESRITNDPNDWATEHENPRYILDLLLSIITVSLKTMEIVKGLPAVEF